MQRPPLEEVRALYQYIRNILFSAKAQARRAVNDAMVQAYWYIGRLIVEDEQGGERRAKYGKRVLPDLAKRLLMKFGKGLSVQSLWSHRLFYLSSRFSPQRGENCIGHIIKC